jgi:hypothetical protein
MADTAASRYSWVQHRGHFAASLIFAAVGIAAAVGLGSGDWYVAEASFYQYPGNTTNPENGFNPSFLGGEFITAYFGLRMGYVCNGPQSAISFGSNRAAQGSNGGVQFCLPYTYRSKMVAFQNLKDSSTDGTVQGKAGDAVTAYFHLIGSSGIIIALLALTVVICGLQFFGSFCLAFGWGESRFTKLPPKVTLIIAIILEALVLIFWITIFPYQYFSNIEYLLAWGAPYSYDVYHSLGTGFSIQIAGILVGIAGFIAYPADAVVMKQGA